MYVPYKSENFDRVAKLMYIRFRSRVKLPISHTFFQSSVIFIFMQICIYIHILGEISLGIIQMKRLEFLTLNSFLI